ncbi:MAG: fibrillarin-like rRNA/tRNA 2'-O-methyltransferase [Candidatus Anstonellales archaeon]
MKEKFSGVFEEKKELYTLNMVRGERVYGEKLIVAEGKEYRRWDPFRSKLAAAIKNGLKNFPFSKKTKLLYLGASTGTTVSHLSDIITDGEIYAVEVSPQAMRSLMEVAEKRENIVPILADARKPESYAEIGKVDGIYQDVAQPDQDDILILNSKKFLKKGGYAFFCVKSQSIDVTKKPEEVFEDVKRKIEKYFEIEEEIRLEPYDKDHLLLVLRFKGF